MKLSELLTDPDPRKWPKVRRSFPDHTVFIQFLGFNTFGDYIGYTEKGDPVYWEASTENDVGWELYEEPEPLLNDGERQKLSDAYIKENNLKGIRERLYDEPPPGMVTHRVHCQFCKEAINYTHECNPKEEPVSTKPKVKRWLWARKVNKYDDFDLRLTFLSESEAETNYCHAHSYKKLPWSETEFDE